MASSCARAWSRRDIGPWFGATMHWETRASAICHCARPGSDVPLVDWFTPCESDEFQFFSRPCSHIFIRLATRQCPGENLQTSCVLSIANHVMLRPNMSQWDFGMGFLAALLDNTCRCLQNAYLWYSLVIGFYLLKIAEATTGRQDLIDVLSYICSIIRLSTCTLPIRLHS